MGRADKKDKEGNHNILDEVDLGTLDDGTVAALYHKMQEEDLDDEDDQDFPEGQ